MKNLRLNSMIPLVAVAVLALMAADLSFAQQAIPSVPAPSGVTLSSNPLDDGVSLFKWMIKIVCVLAPLMGAGLVFPVSEDQITVEPFEIPRYWPQITGIDFGWDHPLAAARLDDAHHAGGAHATVDGDAPLGQLLRDQIGGANFFKTQLGVGVDVTANGRDGGSLLGEGIKDFHDSQSRRCANPLSRRAIP